MKKALLNDFTIKRSSIVNNSRFGHTFYRLFLPLFLLLFNSLSAFSQASPASDNACSAAYNTAWSAGTIGGTGFGAWTFNIGSGGGTYKATDTTINGGGCNTAFGIYTGSNNVITEVYRSFTTSNVSNALQVGQTFSVDLHNGGINAGGSEGFTLRNSNNQAVFELYYANGQSQWTINAGSSSPASNIPYAGNGCQVTFTLTGPTTYSLVVKTPGTGVQTTYGPFTGSLLSPSNGQLITQARFYVSNIGGGNNLQFNNLSIGCRQFSISNHPGNASACVGSTASFTVTASLAAAPTYKWQVDRNSGTFVDAIEGAGADGTGSTTATFTTANTISGMNGYKYRVIVTDACGTALTSDGNATLTVVSNPTISIPSTATACNSPGAASIVSTSAGVNSFAWYRVGSPDTLLTNTTIGGVTYSGATTSTLSMSGLTTSDNGAQFYVVATGCGGNTATSGLSILTVNTASVAPTGATGITTVCSGVNTTLTVNGGTKGSGAVTQWYTGSCGGTLAFTGDVFSTPALTTTTTYFVRYNGTCNITSCATVIVTVNTLSVAPTSITGTTAICNGSNTTLTLSGGSAGTGATAEWFSGSCGGTFVATGNSIVVSPSIGTTYFVRYNGTCNTTSCAQTTVTVNSVPAIGTQPSATAVCSGSQAQFSVVATGTSPSYAWRKRGAGWNTNGTPNTWSLTPGDGGFFRGTSTINGGGSSGIDTGGFSFAMYNNGSNVTEAKRDFAAMTVGQVFQVDMDNGYVNGTVGFALRNSSDANMIELYFTSGTYQINRNGGAISSGLNYTANGIRFTLTVTSPTTFSLMLEGLNGGATVGPFTGNFLNSGSISRFRAFSVNPNSGTNSSIGDNFNLYFNNFKVGSTTTSPFYDDDASNYTGWATGDNKGNSPLTNTSPYSNVATNTLTINPVSVNEVASYDVVVYNSCGAVTSSAAALTITANVGAPSFTGGATTVCQNSTDTTYTATAANSTGISYSVTPSGAGTIDSLTGIMDWNSTFNGQATITATATGCNGPATANRIVTVTPFVGTPNFTAGSTSLCQDASDETYTATASNSTGITYSVSPIGAGTINPTSGLMNWNANFTGQATITASATGCNGPITSNRIVDVSPSVGTPSFTAGATAICQNAANEIYTATAANASGGIFYTVDPEEAGVINDETGLMDWNAAFTGQATITALAFGCNGPTTTDIVVTVSANLTWYRDADHDGYGNPAISQISCVNPTSGSVYWVSNSTDCADSPILVGNPTGVLPQNVRPNATEICYNNIDDDCDGFLSEGCPGVVVNMNPVYNNTVLPTLTSVVSALPYSYGGYTDIQYRFWIQNLTTLAIREFTSPTRFITIPSDIALYATNYDIKVCAVINQEIVPYSGTMIRVTTPASIVTTRLTTATCGVTLAALNSVISANPGTGTVSSYTFRIRLTTDHPEAPELATYYFVTTTNGNRFIGANSFVNLSLQYNTTYSVSVRYNSTINGVSYTSSYGTECTITTPGIPVIGMSTPICGTTLSSMGSSISANVANYALKYRFRRRLKVDETIPAPPSPVYSYTGELNSRFSTIGAITQGGYPLAYNTTYMVAVEYKILNNGIEVWSGYGPECEIRTPEAPFTELMASQCGTPIMNGEDVVGFTPYSVTSATQKIYAVAVPGYTYRFQLQHFNGIDEDPDYDQIVNNSQNWFTLSMFTGLTANTEYKVTVILVSPFGDGQGKNDCILKTPNTTGKTVIALPFAAKAYPNPFANNFLVDLTTESESAVSIKVYDMVGRLVDEKSVEVTNLNHYPIGDRYPSGVYNVVITQGDEVQTLRVVKR